jgi:hypothetical protein
MTVLTAMRNAGLAPEYIEIGNEIDVSGFVPNWWTDVPTIVACINAALAAAKQVFPAAKTMLHSGQGERCLFLFQTLFGNGLNKSLVDILALSYYPYLWSYTAIFDALQKAASQYNKQVMIVETAFDYGSVENAQWLYWDRNPMGQHTFQRDVATQLSRMPASVGAVYFPALGRDFRHLFAWTNQSLTQPMLVGFATAGTDGFNVIAGRGVYRVVGAQSGRCIDTQGGQHILGTPAVIYDCFSVSSNQAWVLLPATGQLQLVGTDKCLAVTGGLGTYLQVKNCLANSSQRFVIQAANGRAGTIRPTVSGGRCIGVVAGGRANNSRLVLWACDGSSNQLWVLQPN